MFEHFIKVVQPGMLEPVYVGPERRLDRRRSVRNEDFERLLRHFGLDRRVHTDRRSIDSSWLITSSKAAETTAAL